MADCEYFNDKLEKMPTASEGVKSMYCQWHYEECARYMVAKVMGSQNIPQELFPPDTLWAEKILTRYNQTH
jgi:hypothetical protein